MYNRLSKRIPDNRFTRRYLRDFPRMAEEYRAKPVPAIPYSVFRLYQTTGSRVEYEAYYFDLRKRCDVFAAMVLSGRGEYLPDLEDALCAVCEEYTWALPAHIPEEHSIEEEVGRIDLFASETAFMLSEIWYLLKDDLDPEVSARMLYELRRRVVDPYLKTFPKWGKNNWSSVCAHGVLTTFIYLGLDGEFRKALPSLLQSLEDFLSSYRDDGYCTEGALYWSYGFESFVYAANLLREYTKGGIDYFKREKVRAIAKYGFCTYFEGNLTLPFADSPHRLNYNIGLYHFLKKEYPVLPLPDESRAAMFGDEARCRFFEMMRNLYWFDESLEGGDPAPVSCDFPLSQVYLRSRPAWHFACKGGHNGESHNHNDVGSFVVICGEEYVLDDPGWPEYDKWYFSEKRYTDYICAMSEGHSLPIINGKGQKPGEEHAGKVLLAEDGRIVIDLSGAYGLDGVTVRRTWLLHEDGVEIRDEITGAESVTERFVTRVEPVPQEDGSLRIAGCVFSSGSGKPEITTATFVPRLVSNIGMKPVETLYLIDWTASDGENVFRLRILPEGENGKL